MAAYELKFIVEATSLTDEVIDLLCAGPESRGFSRAVESSLRRDPRGDVADRLWRRVPRDYADD